MASTLPWISYTLVLNNAYRVAASFVIFVLDYSQFRILSTTYSLLQYVEHSILGTFLLNLLAAGVYLFSGNCSGNVWHIMDN